jgi:hypothetical protein
MMARLQPPEHLLKRISAARFFLTVDKDTRPDTAVFLGWSSAPKQVFNEGFFIKQTPIVCLPEPGGETAASPVYFGCVPGPADTAWAFGVWRVRDVLPNKRAWLEPTWDCSEKQLEELLLTVGFPEIAGNVLKEYPDALARECA